MWKAFMAELRSIHLGAARPRRSVFAELQVAFEAAVRRKPRLPNSGRHVGFRRCDGINPVLTQARRTKSPRTQESQSIRVRT
jgi:hypothetical protein